MAELFGFGHQVPAPEHPWEKSLRRDREISPLVKILEDGGHAKEAALVKANITPQEKKVIADMLGGGGGSSMGVDQARFQEQLANAQSPEDYSQIRQGLINLPSSQATVALKIVDDAEDKFKERQKEERLSKRIEDNLVEIHRNIDEAPKSFPFSNIREAAVGSDSPAVAKLKQASNAGVAMLREAEGGGLLGVKMIGSLQEDAGHNIGKMLGTDPEALKAKLLNPYRMSGLGDMVDKAEQRYAEEKARDLESTPKPAARPLYESNAKKFKEEGYGITGASMAINEAAVNFILDAVDMTLGSIYTLGKSMVSSEPAGRVGRVDAEPEAEAVEALMGAGLMVWSGGALANTLGVGSASGLSTAAKAGAIGGSTLAITEAAKRAEALSNKVMGKPKSDVQAARKEAVGNIASIMATAGVFKAAGAARARMARVASASPPTGKPPSGGGGTKTEPPSTNPKAGAKKPPVKGYNPSSEEGAIYDVSPVTKGMEGVSKSAESSEFTVSGLRRGMDVTKDQALRMHEQIMTSGEMSANYIGQVAKQVLQEEQNDARQSGRQDAGGEGIGRAIGDIHQSVVRGAQVVEEKLASYIRAQEQLDSIPAENKELYAAAKQEADMAEAAHRVAMQNYATLQSAASSQVHAAVNVNQPQPEGGIGNINMRDALNRAIESGGAVPEHEMYVNNFRVQAQANPVVQPKFRNVSDMSAHNRDIANWQRETALAKAKADEKYQKEILDAEQNAYKAHEKTVQAQNAVIERENLRALNDAVMGSLDNARSIPTPADAAIRAAKRMDARRKAAMEPLKKEFEAVKTALKKYMVPPESIQDMGQALEEAFNEAKGLIQSESTKKLSNILAHLLDKISSKSVITLRDIHEAISELNEIVNFSQHEGHSVNKLKYTLKLAHEAFENASQNILKQSKPKAAAALQKTLDRRKAVNEAYAALKATYDNPELAALRKNAGANKEPAYRALFSGAEGLAKASKALGADSAEYQSMLAQKMLEELADPARMGDNARVAKVIKQWDAEEVDVMPAGFAQTMASIDFKPPQYLEPYSPRNVKSISAPSQMWFDEKKVPKAIDIGNDMDNNQIWGMLNTPSGVEKVRAVTMDTPQRREMFAKKAEEILLSGKGEDVEAGHKATVFSKIAGIPKHIIKSVLKPITQWSDAVKKNSELLRALLGDEEFALLKKDLVTLNRIAEQVIRGKSSTVFSGTLVLASLIFHGGLGLGSIPFIGFSLFGLYKQHKGNQALKKQGISTKKKP